MVKTSSLFKVLFLLLSVQSIVLGLYYNNLGTGLLFSLLISSFPLFLLYQAPQSRFTEHVCAAGLMLFSFLHIDQAYGLIEVHFEIFILMAILVVFKNWQIFITALALVAAHHLSFYFLQVNQAGVYVFDPDRLAFTTVLIHAVYATVEAVIAAYIAYMLYQEHRGSQALEDAIGKISSDPKQLDLSVRVDAKRSNALAQFNLLLDAISATVASVNQEQKDLISGAERVAQLQKELTHSAHSKQQQNELIADAGVQVADGFAQVQAQSEQIGGQYGFISKQLQGAVAEVRQTDEQSHMLAQLLNHTEHQLSELASSCTLISSLLNEINAIAEQTNLLALNAAIEAARAGEQGRGFAVVADEVRSLANTSKRATDKIAHTLKQLVDNSNKSTSSMGECITKVHTVEELSSSVLDAISQVEQAMAALNSDSDQVRDIVAQQAANTQQIAEQSEHVRQESKADLQHINDLDTQVSEMMSSLDDLKQQLSRFRTS